MSSTSFPSTDTLLANNTEYSRQFDRGGLDSAPSSQLAIVTCMDTRIDVLASLGIDIGQAHIIRNAGGVITDDVVRSLCLSQRALGTREIIVMHHSKCGVQGLANEQFLADLTEETGETPTWHPGGFDDVHTDVRSSLDQLRSSAFLPHTDHIRGFVYDVDTGLVEEVAD